jgi:hypothetical protein
MGKANGRDDIGTRPRSHITDPANAAIGTYRRGPSYIINPVSTSRDATSLRPALGPAARPVPPATVRRATVFICAGAALAIAAGAFDVIAIRQQAAATLAAPHAGPAFGVIDGLALAALWLWMAWKAGTGRNWARIVSTVFFGLFSIYCGKFATDLFSVTAMKADTAGYLGAVFLEWVMGLVALILLWQHQSSEYFALRARVRASAAA